MPELSRGSLEFVANDNPKVLSYLRTLGDRSVLVVANLSRHIQPLELELSGLEGVEPVELFGRTRFPAIGPGPYRLSIGPHDFYWFGLDRSKAEVEEPDGLPRVSVRGGLAGVLRSPGQLDQVLVTDIVSRRWFRSKAQTVSGGHVIDQVEVPDTGCSILFLQVEYVEQGSEIYAMPLAIATGVDADRLLLDTPAAAIAEIHAGAETGVLYDAAYDPGLARALVRLAGSRRRLRGSGMTVCALPMAESRRLADRVDDETVRMGGTEQSNTSVVIGEELIMKLFRKIDPGPNPEVELGRFLTERTGFGHTAATRGALDVELDGKWASLAVMQQYVPNLGDAWSHTLDALGLVFEQVAAHRAELGRPPAPRHPLDIADAELDHARELIGIPLHEASLLGERTGEMHLALISVPDDPVFAPQRLTTLYQRSLYQSTRSSIRNSFNLLRRRRPTLTPTQLELAEMVLGREHDLIEGLRSITTEKIDAVRLRVHGDYHLGQVLFTGNDFVIIDFEGEPQRPLSERRIKRLGLRDVAGMLRSYQYTTQMALRAALEGGVEGPGRADALAEWADALARWLAAAFLRGYLATVEGTPIVPSEQTHLKRLLDTLLLDKAAYELGYELNNRPDWVDIPLRGLLLASTAYA
jgi:maltose alpha-D-glucosyltransferase/alpha-amylase